MARGPFEQIVFSGGGLRCYWQGGFMDVVRDPLELEPDRIVGVSGGAMSAAGFISHRGHEILDRMREAFAACDSNVNLDDLDDDHGRTPHQRIFHEVVTDVFDAEAQARVADGPAFQIQIAHPPADDVPALSGAAMTLAYEAELHTVNSPHFSWAERFGLGKSLIDAREAARQGRLAELIKCAVTIPPVFRTPEWEGRPVIDGGMAGQAPMPEPDRGKTLILLTRQYRQLPSDPSRRYLMPSEEAPVDKIDFTDPRKLTQTWELGQEDGQAFLSTWNEEEE
jgi:predicted acylesterase/phospholipase RssA